MKGEASTNDHWSGAAAGSAPHAGGVARPPSYQVAEDLAAGTLVRLLPKTEPPPLPVQLVAHSDAHMAPKVRMFLEHAAERLRR